MYNFKVNMTTGASFRTESNRYMLHIYIRKMLIDSLPIPFFFCPTEKIPSAPEIARNCDRAGKCARMHKNQMAAITIRFNEDRLESHRVRCECDQITN